MAIRPRHAITGSISFNPSWRLAGGNGRVLQELNKTLRFAKSVCHHKMQFLAAPENVKDRDINNMAIIMFVDAAFSVRKDHGS